MSREIRRVPLDFDWPLHVTWQGYLMPPRLCAAACPACGESGYSPRAAHLFNQWYGYAPFDPAETGSTPLTPDTPSVRAFAERNVRRTPEFYGTGEAAIRREALRLCGLWNKQWNQHLAQPDVDALIAAGRLRDLTHTWDPATRRWQPVDPAPAVTAEQVGEWNRSGFGHDALNAWVVIGARCKREGVPETCGTCGGSGQSWRDEQHRADHDAWTRTPPPTGDGWQMWETVSEGSPASPVFPTDDALVDWLHTAYRPSCGPRLTRGEARAFVTAGSSLGSFVVTGGQMVSGERAAGMADAGGGDRG